VTRWVRALIACGLIVCAGCVLALSLYKNRDRYDKPDFRSYYANALLLRNGGNPWKPSDIISSLAQSAGRNAAVAVRYPPAFYLLLSPLTFLEKRTAYWIWQAIQIGSLAGALLLVLNEVYPAADLATNAAAVALVFLFPQLYGSLYDSQPTCLLLLLLVGSWLSERHRHPGRAALMLAAATLLKIYPAAVGGYFLFRGRWRVIVFAAFYVLAGLALAVLLFGAGPNLDFLRVVRMGVNPYWLDLDREISLLGNIHVLLSGLDGTGVLPVVSPLELGLTASVGAAIVALAGYVTSRMRKVSAATDGLCLGLWLVVAILLSPLAWAHYLILLAPLYLCIGSELIRRANLGETLSLPPASSRPAFVLVLAGLAGFIVPYFWGPVRRAHVYFPALLVTLVAACVLTHTWSAEATTRPPS
jgi:glycosyl transferase family 87